MKARDLAERRAASYPPLRQLLARLALAAAFCLVLLVTREWLGGRRAYAFLAWNLFLAAAPLALALLLEAASRARRRYVAMVLALLWLLFFPNAPYVLTDFVHLASDPPVPLWFDVLLFNAFAWTSLALGFVSLGHVRALTRSRWSKHWNWTGLLVLFAVSGLAIYLGRFAHQNSWDVLTHPGAVLRAVFARGSAMKEIEVTVGFAAFLAVAYAVFEAVAATESSTASASTKRAGVRDAGVT